MRDLLVITPSRGRPERLREMLDACRDLSTAETDYAVGIDEDQAGLYAALQETDPRVRLYLGPRDTLTGWTNTLARLRAHEYRALASFGDDHRPRTPGWDSLLLAAIGQMGGTGIAYGNDGIFDERLPTAPVISSDIVRALEWMCLPSLRHMAVDLVWKDLGEAAGCLAHVPGVTVEHVHWCAGKAPLDQVYAESEAGKEADRAAYFAWKDGGGLDKAAATVRALREKAGVRP
jgi:hypothetical protein